MHTCSGPASGLLFLSAVYIKTLVLLMLPKATIDCFYGLTNKTFFYLSSRQKRHRLMPPDPFPPVGRLLTEPWKRIYVEQTWLGWAITRVHYEAEALLMGKHHSWNSAENFFATISTRLWMMFEFIKTFGAMYNGIWYSYSLKNSSI